MHPHTRTQNLRHELRSVGFGCRHTKVTADGPALFEEARGQDSLGDSARCEEND